MPEVVKASNESFGMTEKSHRPPRCRDLKFLMRQPLIVKFSGRT